MLRIGDGQETGDLNRLLVMMSHPLSELNTGEDVSALAEPESFLGWQNLKLKKYSMHLTFD